ncbi:stage V sporulation protein AD [Paenalkalicoccus suaedae]|uniref:Stage V sporulation protein AD n=1 Tax=Paenalkalicoccus suaedae TaxID=2592382 RepID=A0A859FEN2_9BACI|nr:stage V sporulation protein AD [Paenalkalicoccus suaedae]QKS71044.1 stage V sporulation protein AD [Paenalkalicoccus suaedae]
MLVGKQSWQFTNQPVIISTGVIGGPFEKQGAMADYFDQFGKDIWFNQPSFEQAQKQLFEEACHIAFAKSKLQKEDMSFVFAGDLLNQITSTSFAMRALQIPYFGLFGACSTSMEGLAMAAFISNYKGANYVLTGATSHNAAIEKTFRYPTEYGSQKPPTAQWTVTASGVAIVSQQGEGPIISSATIGKVLDEGIEDPYNMGAAMAPAAVDTILAHLRDLNKRMEDYDLIVTGDLGEIGHAIAKELLEKAGHNVQEGIFIDAGMNMYKSDQAVQAGASGAGCSAAYTYGRVVKKLQEGLYNNVLIVATGALLSPLTFQQHETIPAIAHAVALKGGKS